jgi:hypothetical protein
MELESERVQRAQLRPQAIAKAETVRGDAARLGRSAHAVPMQAPAQDGPAAPLLLVRSGRAPDRYSGAQIWA